MTEPTKPEPGEQTPESSRARAWKTRRAKYGNHGHSGSYSGNVRVVYLQTWNARMRSMQDMLIRLFGEGVLSEGQVSKATGIDRVSCRELAQMQPAPAEPATPLGDARVGSSHLYVTKAAYEVLKAELAEAKEKLAGAEHSPCPTCPKCGWYVCTHGEIGS